MAALQKDNSNPGDFHINMFSTNGISRSKFQYKVYLCKTFEYAALVFKNCGENGITIKNMWVFFKGYIGHTNPFCVICF